MAGGAGVSKDSASGLNALNGTGALSYQIPAQLGGGMYSTGGLAGLLQDPKMQHLLGGIGQQLMQRQNPQMQSPQAPPMMHPMMTGGIPQMGAPMQQGAPQFSPAPWMGRPFM